MASAQDLKGSFISLHNANNNGNSPQPQRGAVLGQVTVDAPVVPNANRDATPTFWGNAFPFVLDPFYIDSMRYQQIYAASQFPNGGVIDELRFRRAFFGEEFENLQLDVEIRVSYAARSTTNASYVFADNVGSGVTTVYDGMLTLSSTATTVPLPFDVVIDVADTFVYDPSLGDLLVDFFVRDSNYSFETYLEATPYPASESATTRIFNYSVDEPSGYTDLQYGLVTQIAFDTPPDPADWYRFDLKSGESATVALNVLGGNDAQVALVGSNGTTLALGSSDQADNVDQNISNFVATSTGTYYLKVSSDRGATYSLVVTRNADFDTEANDSIEKAQPIISPEAAGARWVEGYLSASGGGSGSAVVGYYTDFNVYDTAPAGAIVEAGLTPVQIVDIAAFDLSTIDILMVDESSNYGLSFELQDNLDEIQAWVEGGGIFVVHDRFVTNDYGDPQPNPFLLGAPDSLLDRDFANGWNLDVIPPGDTLVINGPFGTITNTTLDGGSSSSHGFAIGSTLPEGSVPILSNGPDPDHVAAFSYSLGIGSVYYSTIPLDFYLYGSYPETFRTIYAPNMLTYAQSLSEPDTDWYRITADGNKTIAVETSTPAYQSGEYRNDLDPIVRLYDAEGKWLATNDNGASDGRNAKLSYKVPKNGGGTFYVEVAASLATSKVTSGEYILSVKGSNRTLPPFVVTETDPADESRVYTAPQQFEVSFNDTVSVPTLQGTDFLLNDRPARGVTSVDGDTVQFENALAFQWTPDLGGNSHYYLLTSSPKPWLDAQAEAVSLGGNLVTVNDQAEQNFLKRAFFSGPDKFRNFWMGINDIAQEGNFVWASGEPVTYTNWTPPYQPDDFGIGEDGGEINWDAFYNNGGWNDGAIDFKTYGIIELTSLPAGFALAKEGLNTFSIVSGSIKDIQGTSVTAYNGSFILDTTPPVVTATTPSEDDFVTPGAVTISVTFSESMDTTTIGPSQLSVYGSYYASNYVPSISSWNPDSTVLTLTYDNLPEDAYELRLVGDDVNFQDLLGLDLDGNRDLVEGGTFILQFYVDGGIRSIPVPLEAVQPMGSLIYQTPSAASGTIAPNSDTDDWTISLDPGQTITVLLNPANELVGMVEVIGPDTSSLGSATGVGPYSSVLLQTIPAGEAGTYTVRIGGAFGTAGRYSFELTVNAALEEEALGGQTNSDLPGAQSINGSFIPLVSGADRGAVRGVSGDDDVYSFDLAVGQSLTAAVAFDTPLTTFQRSDYYGYGVTAIALGDVNDDGILDVVSANNAYYSIGMRLGLGDGSFGPEMYVGYANSPNDVQLADVEGDGDLDIISANNNGGYDNASISVFKGLGDGSFGGPENYFAGYSNFEVAVGDVSGDGALDLVTTNRYDYTVNILVNNGAGTGTFGDAIPLVTVYDPTGVALADMDGVNGLDIIVASYSSAESLSVFLNQGGGSFDPNTRTGYFAGYNNYRVAVGDFNDDGRPDVATTYGYYATVDVLLNSGDGTLGARNLLLARRTLCRGSGGRRY